MFVDLCRLASAASLAGCLTVAGLAQTGTPVSTLTSPASDPQLTMPPSQLTPQQIAGMQHRLADWPDLARYRDENAKLGPPAPGEQRIVFLGNSITDFWGHNFPQYFKPNAPHQIWINRGISGQTTPQALVRFQQDVVALRPEVVVILTGTNDIAGNTGPESLGHIEDNFRSMVAIAKAAHIRVVLSSVTPAARYPWRPSADPRDEVAALNAWLEQYAAAEGQTYLDYFPALAGPDRGMRPEFAKDGIHPTAEGYAVMQPLAQAAIAKALAKPRP